jgi:hypothetical protein
MFTKEARHATAVSIGLIHPDASVSLTKELFLDTYKYFGVRLIDKYVFTSFFDLKNLE